VSDITDEDAKLKPVEPIGIRDDEGVVRTIEEVEKNEELRDLRLKIGMEEDEEEMMVFAGGRADGLGPASNISDNEALRRAVSCLSHASSLVVKRTLTYISFLFIRRSPRQSATPLAKVLRLKSRP
jgi:hypothetical protein